MKELMKLNKELILNRTILPTFFNLCTYFSKQSTFLQGKVMVPGGL